MSFIAHQIDHQLGEYFSYQTSLRKYVNDLVELVQQTPPENRDQLANLRVQVLKSGRDLIETENTINALLLLRSVEVQEPKQLELWTHEPLKTILKFMEE